jgi:hypothetical protein
MRRYRTDVFVQQLAALMRWRVLDHVTVIKLFFAKESGSRWRRGCTKCSAGIMFGLFVKKIRRHICLDL